MMSSTALFNLISSIFLKFYVILQTINWKLVELFNSELLHLVIGQILLLFLIGIIVLLS